MIKKLLSFWKGKTMKKRILDLELRKDGLNVYLKIKASPEIEKFYKDLAFTEAKEKTGNDLIGLTEIVQVSAKWVDEAGQGLRFYPKVEKLSNKVNEVRVIDNFGNGLYDEGKQSINVALLRIVGITEGITMRTNDLLGYEEMKQYIEQLAVWSKAFYREHLQENTIKATVSFEV